jgi:hypothetical protein
MDPWPGLEVDLENGLDISWLMFYVEIRDTRDSVRVEVGSKMCCSTGRASTAHPSLPTAIIPIKPSTTPGTGVAHC